jgi:hypothetical protein
MTKWKVTLYLTDECGGHTGEEACKTPPMWYDGDLEDYDGFEYGHCWSPVPKGELETEVDARNWMETLLKYGDKHQDATFVNRTIERVEE